MGRHTRRLLALVGGLLPLLAGGVGALAVPASASGQESHTIVVRKGVDGGAPEGARYRFRVDCPSIDLSKTFGLRADGTREISFSYAGDRDLSCTVRETKRGGAERTTYRLCGASCTEPMRGTEAPAEFGTAEESGTRELVVFTNHFSGGKEEQHALNIAKSVKGDAPDSAEYKVRVSCSPRQGINGTYTLVRGKPKQLQFTYPGEHDVDCTVTEIKQGGAQKTTYRLCGANCTEPKPGMEANVTIDGVEDSGTAKRIIFTNTFETRDQAASGDDQQSGTPGSSGNRGQVTVRTGNGGVANTPGSKFGSPVWAAFGVGLIAIASAGGLVVRKWKLARR